ncbi:MAG: hypothetical protein AAFO79_08010, partial [Pseudomonadota bacterium]
MPALKGLRRLAGGVEAQAERGSGPAGQATNATPQARGDRANGLALDDADRSASRAETLPPGARRRMAFWIGGQAHTRVCESWPIAPPYPVRLVLVALDEAAGDPRPGGVSPRAVRTPGSAADADPQMADPADAMALAQLRSQLLSGDGDGNGDTPGSALSRADEALGSTSSSGAVDTAVEATMAQALGQGGTTLSAIKRFISPLSRPVAVLQQERMVLCNAAWTHAFGDALGVPGDQSSERAGVDDAGVLEAATRAQTFGAAMSAAAQQRAGSIVVRQWPAGNDGEGSKSGAAATFGARALQLLPENGEATDATGKVSPATDGRAEVGVLVLAQTPADRSWRAMAAGRPNVATPDTAGTTADAVVDAPPAGEGTDTASAQPAARIAAGLPGGDDVSRTDPDAPAATPPGLRGDVIEVSGALITLAQSALTLERAVTDRGEEPKSAGATDADPDGGPQPKMTRALRTFGAAARSASTALRTHLPETAVERPRGSAPQTLSGTELADGSGVHALVHATQEAETAVGLVSGAAPDTAVQPAPVVHEPVTPLPVSPLPGSPFANLLSRAILTVAPQRRGVAIDLQHALLRAELPGGMEPESVAQVIEAAMLETLSWCRQPDRLVLERVDGATDSASPTELPQNGNKTLHTMSVTAHDAPGKQRMDGSEQAHQRLGAPRPDR